MKNLNNNRNYYRHYLVIAAFIGGLWFSAAMSNTATYALSDSSSDPTTSTPTTTTDTSTDATTTTPATTDTDTTDVTTPTTTDTADTTATTTPTDDSTTTTPAPDTSSDTSTDPATNNATIDNGIDGSATSGTASVTDSQNGGNATTGTASDIANLLNAIQSTGSLSDGGLQTFTDNINGNVNGDIDINPLDYLTGSGQAVPVDDEINNNGTINNNVDLTASTGDATVQNNRVGGDATTGDALTEANIINLINSSITDGESFLGTININGNLNGNILLPADVLDGLLNQGPPVNGDAGSNVTNINNEDVINNITLLAQTGNASVLQNGDGGNATTGNASTNLNLYNLANSDIVAGNLLLVFVNVSGTWEGLLFNVPTTSAAIGGGVQQDSAIPAGSNITDENNELIENNIYLDSTSGNALVAYNRHGGNATSGNATSDANVVNILGDQIDLTGWLGILVINVFGSWTGNLGVQVPTVASSVNSSNGSLNNTSSITAPKTKNVYIFKAHVCGGTSSEGTSETNTTTGSQTSNDHKPGSVSNFASTIPKLSGQKDKTFNYALGIIGFAVAGVSILGERIFSIFIRP